ADGVPRSEVSLVSTGSSAGLRTSKVRVRNVTVIQAATAFFTSTGPLVDALWLEGCSCTGPGRTTNSTNVWHLSAWTEKYITDSTVTDYSYGIIGATLVRNVSVG